MSCYLKKTQLTRRRDFAEKNVFRKQGDRFLEDANVNAAGEYCGKREELLNQGLNRNSLQKKEAPQWERIKK